MNIWELKGPPAKQSRFEYFFYICSFGNFVSDSNKNPFAGVLYCPFWPHTTLNLARRNVIIFAISAHSPFPYIHENYSGPLNLFSALLRWPWLMLLRPTEEDWELYGACVEGDTHGNIWDCLSDWMFCPHSTSAYKNAHEIRQNQLFE